MKPKEKYKELARLRSQEPVVWAVLMGDRTITDVSLRLAMGPNEVRRGIDRNEDLGSHEHRVWIKRDHPLYGFAEGLLKKLEQGAALGSLTERQRETLDRTGTLIKPFSAADLAKELGYRNSGYTYRNLEALKKKGYLVKLEGKPIRWEYSPAYLRHITE